MRVLDPSEMREGGGMEVSRRASEVDDVRVSDIRASDVDVDGVRVSDKRGGLGFEPEGRRRYSRLGGEWEDERLELDGITRC